jgi:glycosyltransferase involved in cell wall biosynthesis
MPEGIMARSSVIPHIALERFRLAGEPNNQRFTLCHAGNLGRPRSATVFLKGVKTFLTETNNCRTVTVKFLGSNTEDLAPIIHDLHLEDYVSVEPPKPYEESLEILAQSDVLVIIEASCAEGIFLPSKYVDYIQTGRPILALSPAVGTLADIIAEHGGGLAVDCRSAEAVARAIKTLYSHWQLGTLDETYGSSGLFELFNENIVLSLYLETFKRISFSLQNEEPLRD